MQVKLTAEVQTSGLCSVAGGYKPATMPPSLWVANASSPGRRQFTVLHELGHHLQNTDPGLGTGLLNADEDGFEDAACDLFAARVLLPDDLVAACFGDRTPTPGDIVALYRRSTASRAACVVRAVEHLRSFGAVVLYDTDGIVSFAAGRGSVYPPARGSDQSQTPLVAAALQHLDRPDGVPITVSDTVIAYRTGHTSGRLYGQAAWCDGFLVAVLVEDHAPWQSFSPTRPPITMSQPRWAGCELCQDSFEVTGACATCREPRCPSGHCACTMRRQRRCERCTMTYDKAMFVGTGTVCRECI
ncbi:ImmA/IrrE family metallo-endopeptidase [Dactylosporangium sp. NPDC005555]|uniref:ImmA/IrrE family metallo-endopeptidase n=1 Tax=Dactylosporangium sp. NPDC005555 TaxID=3154889 RepID=UPI0033BD0676